MAAISEEKLKPWVKVFNRVIAVAIILAAAFLAYTVYEIRVEMFKVFETRPEYRATSPDADLVVVEFVDYTCESCRTFHPQLREAMARDGKITYIPRPLAMDDVWKTRLASAVYAAGLQGQAVAMHHAIFEKWPVMSDEKLFEVAKGLKLDTHQFSRDLRSDAARDAVLDNIRFYDVWMLQGVPVLLVGGTMIYIPNNTTPSADEIYAKFQEARQ